MWVEKNATGIRESLPMLEGPVYQFRSAKWKQATVYLNSFGLG